MAVLLLKPHNRLFCCATRILNDTILVMDFQGFAKRHRIEIIIFSLAIVLRLGLFFSNLNVNHGNFIDTIRGGDGYYEISRNLIIGNGYSDDVGPVYRPNSLRPPVWIYLMALIAGTFGSYVPVFIFELVLGSLIPVIGMRLALRVVSHRLALLTGVFLALEPYSVLFTILANTETCFTFFFLIFSLFTFKYIEKQSVRNAVWAGLFLGLATLVKPTVQFLPILVPLAFLYIFRKTFSRAHLVHALCFLAVCLSTIAPWVYRNYREFGTWALTSQVPLNLNIALVPTILAVEHGTNYEAERTPYLAQNNILGVDINPANGKYLTRKALSIIAEHKMAMIQSIGISIATFFTHDGMVTTLAYSGVFLPNFIDKPVVILLLTDPIDLANYILLYAKTPGVLVFLARLLWITITIFFFTGAWLYCRREKMTPFALYAMFIVAYFALTTTVNGFGMNARFRMPVNGFIFMFAFYGCAYLYRFFKNKRAQHA